MVRRPNWLSSLTKAHAKAPDRAAEPESLKSTIDNQRSRMLSLQAACPAVISDVDVLRPHQIGQHREHRWGVQNYCGEGFAAG